MARSTRRDFLKTTAGAAVWSGFGGATALAKHGKRTATDWVTLGKSKVKVTRLALGTGTFGGRVQRDLSQEDFTRLVRHAYDHGIRFFETAEAYREMPERLAAALKGLPRDSYRLMTKFEINRPGDASARIDQFRRQLNTEYIDILLLHCVRKPTWPSDTAKLQDEFSEAQHKKIIMAHGASVHGLQALRAFPGTKWLEVSMIRMNQNGTRMDTESMRDSQEPGNVDEVVANARKVHQQGSGVISMKLVGEGRFTRPEDRDAAIKFAFNAVPVDCVTIGFKNTQEIDEAIDRFQRVLNA